MNVGSFELSFENWQRTGQQESSIEKKTDRHEFEKKLEKFFQMSLEPETRSFRTRKKPRSTKKSEQHGPELTKIRKKSGTKGSLTEKFPENFFFAICKWSTFCLFRNGLPDLCRSKWPNLSSFWPFSRFGCSTSAFLKSLIFATSNQPLIAQLSWIKNFASNHETLKIQPIEACLNFPVVEILRLRQVLVIVWRPQWQRESKLTLGNFYLKTFHYF